MELCRPNSLINNPIPIVLPVFLSGNSEQKEEEETTISPRPTTDSDYYSNTTGSTGDPRYVSSSSIKPDQEQASNGQSLKENYDKTYMPTILLNYRNINKLTTFPSNNSKINNSLSLKIEHDQTLIIFNENIPPRTLCKIDDGIILDESGGSTEYLI